MGDRYVIISADAHAGLPCEEYRPYLDERYHRAFDAFLAERQANRDQQMKLNYDYITNWETEHEEGLRGAYDPAQRDKEMDADGVAAEVIFPDADAITGMESPPFGAGLSAGTIEDPELAFAGARAHHRFLVELCAGSLNVAGRTADLPRRHVAEIEWLADAWHRRVMIPTMWWNHTPYNDPHTTRFAGRRPRTSRAHALRECPRGDERVHRHHLAEVSSDPPADLTPLVQWRLCFPGLKLSHRVLLGRRHEVEVGPVLRRWAHPEEDGRTHDGHPVEAPV